ncbi:hypothetical protein CYL18_10860 [Pradoshia eiseniae]|uniref:Uncharacterized protein n=1 Tax=Pradoshia eiseniae TaxID=2064768 RepID=A0A2S7MZV4_9BACI|nr:hypothetical protein CYL18_10860 [Pradoshia eiseniae]
MKTEQSQFVFYLIESSAIKQFFLLDMLTGTGLYYLCKFCSSSILIGMIGSVVGVEGIRRAGFMIRNLASR